MAPSPIPKGFAKKVRLLWLDGTTEPERMRDGIRGFRKALSDAGIDHVYYESPGPTTSGRPGDATCTTSRRGCSVNPARDSTKRPLAGGHKDLLQVAVTSQVRKSSSGASQLLSHAEATTYGTSQIAVWNFHSVSR